MASEQSVGTNDGAAGGRERDIAGEVQPGESGILGA
jgi:hypothetical protein